jgi:hypothetical protein
MHGFLAIRRLVRHFRGAGEALTGPRATRPKRGV